MPLDVGKATNGWEMPCHALGSAWKEQDWERIQTLANQFRFVLTFSKILNNYALLGPGDLETTTIQFLF